MPIYANTHSVEYLAHTSRPGAATARVSMCLHQVGVQLDRKVPGLLLLTWYVCW